MNTRDETQLRRRTADIVIAWAESRTPPVTGESKAHFPDLIEAAHIVADEGRLALHRWIDAARRSGMSWTEVGDVLGISKQAAQQRFRASDEQRVDEVDDTGLEIVRTGATAFNELAILREEGKKGNELIRTGPLFLAFRRTDRVWEYRRTLGGAPDESWSHVSTWFPFSYFKRAVD